MDERRDGWIDRWMDGWMDFDQNEGHHEEPLCGGCIYVCMYVWMNE